MRDDTPLVGIGGIGNLYLNKDMNREKLRTGGQKELAVTQGVTWQGCR